MLWMMMIRLIERPSRASARCRGYVFDNKQKNGISGPVQIMCGFQKWKKNRLHFTNARALTRVYVCDVLQRVEYVVHGLYVWFYCTGIHHDMRGFNEEATRPAAVVAPGNNITPLVTNHSWTTWRRGYTMLQQPQGQQGQRPGKRTSCRGFRGPPITSRAASEEGKWGECPRRLKVRRAKISYWQRITGNIIFLDICK